MITIITTTYKHEDFIAETIESILSQTFTNWELLIWDDSPDDKTWNIIQQYVKKYPDKIKAWHHKPNKWIVDNMNFLLEKVSNESKYIAFLEWDDLFTIDNLEKKVKAFEENKEVVLVTSSFSEIDEKWTIRQKPFFHRFINIFSVRKTFKEWINKINFENFLSFPWNPIKSFWSVMIKKELLKEYLPLKNLDKNSKMFWPSDYFLWLQLLPWREFFYTDKKLLKYRVHSENFSWDWNKKVMNNQWIMIFDYFLDKYKNDKNIIKAINYRKYFKESLDNTIMWNKKEWFKYFLKTFEYYKFKFLISRIKLLIRIMTPNTLLKKMNII